MNGIIMHEDIQKGKRGPSKKPGFRQELRITPTVEKLFLAIKEKYQLKHNSDALNIIAQLFITNFEDILPK